jgi:leader peptidase (prepilin peptidase)/N-methyltransferase
VTWNPDILIAPLAAGLPADPVLRLYLLTAILMVGLCLGSFIAAATWRLPRRIGLTGRSACPACGTRLGVRDLVPVLSWLAARGRCRHCGTPVSPRYAVVELATAALWVGCLLATGEIGRTLLLGSLGTLLLLAALIDLDHLYLPDGVTALAGLLALVPPLTGQIGWGTVLAGAGLFAGVALAVRAAVSWRTGREAMGLGDVKLFAVAGLWLGPAALAPFLLLAGIGGLAMAGATRLVGQGGPAGREEIGEGEGEEMGSDGDGVLPFGPALALALMVLLLLPPAGWGTGLDGFGWVG